jgi:hypothetical protein
MGAAFDRLKNSVFSLQGAFVTLLGGLAVREVIKTGAAFEQLRIQLKTVTGSVEQAAIEFDKIKTLAVETPFSVQNLTKSFIRLKAVGIQPTAELLTTFGDVAAGLGRDITDFTRAAVGAAFGETEALKGFGIAAKVTGDQIAFTFNGVTTVVNRNAQEVIAALQKIGAENFAGAAEDQVNSFNGAVSNFGDAMDAFLDEIARAGVLDTFADAIKIAGGEIERLTNSGAAQQLGESFTESLRRIALGVAGVLDALAPIFDIAVNGINRLIAAYNSIPAEAQGIGLIGLMLLGKKGGAAIIAGLGIADEAAKASEKILNDLGVAKDSVLRDIFVGGTDGTGENKKTTIGLIGDDAGYATQKVAELLAKMDEAKANRNFAFEDNRGRTRSPVPAVAPSQGQTHEQKEAFDDLAKSMKEANDQRQIEIDTFGMSDVAREKALANLKYENELNEIRKTLTGDQIAELDALNAKQLEQMDIQARLKQAEEDVNALLDKRKELMEEGQEVIKANRDAWAIYADEIDRLNVLLQEGVINQDNYNAAQERAAEVLINNDPVLSRTKEGFTSLSNAMVDGLAEGQKAGDIFKNWFRKFALDIIKELQAMIIKKMLFNAVMSSTSAGGGGGFGLGSLVSMGGNLFGAIGGSFTGGVGGTSGLSFGDALTYGVSAHPSLMAKGGAWRNGVQFFANGGVVGGPTAFGTSSGLGIMGEAGPEAIMPLRRGPDGKLGVAGSGGGTVINIDARGSNGDAAVEAAVERGIRRAAPNLVNASVQRVRDERRRDPRFFGGGVT